MAEYHAVARVRAECVRGETTYSAQVFLAAKGVFTVPEAPTEQSCLLDVLEWAQRTGKERILKWQHAKPIARKQKSHETKTD